MIPTEMLFIQPFVQTIRFVRIEKGCNVFHLCAADERNFFSIFIRFLILQTTELLHSFDHVKVYAVACA